MKLTLLLATLFLAACQPVGATKEASDFPIGTQRIVAPGNYITWVVPLTMDDGTKCLVAVKNGSGGASLVCNFK